MYWDSFNQQSKKSNLRKMQCSRISKQCGMACIPKSRNCRLNSDDIERVVSSYEKSIANASVENAVVVNPDNGNIIFSAKGNENSITFSPAQARAMKGAIFSHNHPNLGYGKDDPRSKGFSFSESDLQTAFYTGVKEMRACCSGYQHSITGNWSKELWDRKGQSEYQKAYSKQYSRSLRKAFLGGDIRQLEADFHHQVSQAFAKNMGLKYKRTEWKK